MTEPEYHYVKGQGWVLSLYPSITFTRRHETIRLTLRTPEEGEHFHCMKTGKDRALEYVKDYLLRSREDHGVVFSNLEWGHFKHRPDCVVIDIISST